MSIPEAIKGARVELAKLPPLQRIPLLARYARIFAAELFGTVLAVPFGLRAFSLHRSLPDARQQRAGSSVSILRNVRYGSRDRNLMDVYLPPNIELKGGLLEGIAQGSGSGGAAGAPAGGGNGNGGGGSAGAPVVLFCHGGVWASGSAWHYAPLATRLAQAGVITAVMQYTLFPNALVPQMVAEVSRALTWTLDNAEQLGGSPQQVSLVGHSAGAHMCTMALLHRALAASKSAASPAAAAGQPSAAGASSNGNGSAAAPPAALAAAPAAQGLAETTSAAAAMGSAEEEAAHQDPRMPCRLVAMAGVYDIAKHFEYEEARHVHKLSTMERAIGGPGRFPEQSPAVILANALRRRNMLQQRHRSWPTLAGDPRELLQEAGVLSSGTAWDAVLSDYKDAGTQLAAGPHCTLVQSAISQQAAAAAAQGDGEAGMGRRPPADAVAAARYYSSFELAGEAIARRIGFDRVAAAEAEAVEAAAEAASAAAAAGGTPREVAAAAAAAAARRAVAVAAVPAEEVPGAAGEATTAGIAPGEVQSSGIMALSVEAARRLPPTVLTSSCTDLTVPWYESAEMYWMLRDCGVPAKHLVYNKVGHGDFVTAWTALPRLSGEPTADVADLAPQCADLVKVVSGAARVRYS